MVTASTRSVDKDTNEAGPCTQQRKARPRGASAQTVDKDIKETRLADATKHNINKQKRQTEATNSRSEKQATSATRFFSATNRSNKQQKREARVLSCKCYQCKETVITAEKKSILHLKNEA